ncbi:MAG: T9SS type A sorting domain-containing protein [Fluviicola sp.]
MKAFLLCIIFVFTAANFFAQRGKNGNYTVTAASTQVNAYTSVTANAAVNATTISVTSSTLTSSVLTTALAPGDLIMIIQMQGATLDINTTPTTGWGSNYTLSNGAMADLGNMNNYRDDWGQITNYNSAGKYELVEVRSVPNATSITLMCGLKNAYTASGHVQIVRVPRFVDLTVNTGCSIVAFGWDGTVGGVVALEVNGNLALNGTGTISATGLGFRGGALDPTGFGPAAAATDVGKPGYSAVGEGAEKGEGIGGYATAEYTTLFSRYGNGSAANGGGGGNYRNSGGGGGSNIGTGTYTGYGVPNTAFAAYWNLELAGMSAAPSSGGGRGGYTFSTSNQNEATLGPNQSAWSGDFRRNEGGIGGHPLAYDATRLFMGGGGGSGEQDGTQGGAGGRGGGIVHITVYGTTSGTGTIQANGANGQNSNPSGLVAPGASAIKYGNDGAGGAGAGGYIAISNGVALPASITLSATGGTGGNQVLSFGSFATPLEASGPGGGGSGGGIAFTSGSPTQNAVGGANGTTNSSQVNAFPPNGATAGAAGMTSLPFSFYNVNATDVTICANTSTTLNATVIGTLPAGGALTWYTTQFGSTVAGTGASFTTPVLSATTMYYLGVCPGTFRIPVTVTVNSASITGTLTIPVGGTTALSGSGTAAAVSPWVSSTPGIGTVDATGLVTGISPGTTTITYTTSNGCIATVVVTVTTPLPITLLDFDVQQYERNSALVTWITETEQFCDYFNVLRTQNLSDWSVVAKVDGAGNSDIPREYAVIDSALSTGQYYYRLTQVDLNGEISSFEIRSVNIGSNEWKIYPNPTDDLCTLEGVDPSRTTLKLYDLLGKELPILITILENDRVLISLEAFEPGVYSLVIDDQTSSQTIRLIRSAK